jgi:hypothetical protein
LRLQRFQTYVICCNHNRALLLLPLLLQAKKQKAAELEVRRKEHVRAAIMGQNFIEGEQRTSAYARGFLC